MNKQNSIIRKIYREKDIEKIEKKINMLGSKVKFDATTFMNTRIITTVIVFVIVLYKVELGYVFAPLFSILHYYLYYYLLITRPLNIRIKKLVH